MKRVSLNSFQLKCIAIIFMVIDHIGAVLYPQVMIYRYMGRISFPIFCFLLVEGFYYTRDVRKYILRLGIFAIISEVPYDLALHDSVLEWSKQNVFFSLALALFCLYMMAQTNALWVQCVYVCLAMWAAEWFRLDYGFRGVLLVLIFYSFRSAKPAGYLFAALWNFIRRWRIQGYGVFALIPIALYNRKRGPKMKYFFYCFYPLHLLILVYIKRSMW